LFFYYQPTGGDEKWIPIQENRAHEFNTIRPTFVTVLAIDTLLDDRPTREETEKARYLGSLYFDLDAEDIEDSIAGAQQLLARLIKEGLEEQDIQIFLSGKKGLHLLVPMGCFVEKPAPQVRLPAIYKEMALRYAVDTLDHKVYTARKGRMLRTPYNIRENGNYKVSITAEELRSLTGEGYSTLCKVPRVFSVPPPIFRPTFALEYLSAKQKALSVKQKKTKPVDLAALQSHAPTVQQVMRGENLADVGFNKIAIQLALYARESNMSEDALVEACAGLISNHESDGSRYNSPAKREGELRRMFFYVEDNFAYEYAFEPIKALVYRAPTITISESGEVTDSATFSCGVTISGNCYTVSKGDAGDMAISNFLFTDVKKLIAIADEQITGLVATMQGLGGTIKMLPSTFAGSSNLNAAVMPFGGSFTGTDNHARGLYQIMLKAVSETKYLIDSEGLNLVSLIKHPNPALKEPFVVWADNEGVKCPQWVTDLGIEFEFQGFPTPEGVLETDLTKAPNLDEFLSVEGNKEELTTMLTALFTCQTPEVIGKLLGWMTASFWRQLLHHAHGQFPLLHVYGTAGSGKSSMTEDFLSLFYYKKRPVSVTPSGTPFAFLALVGGSGSIPVMLDEYKPSTMNREVLEKYRATMRDAYNMKTTSRGGGSRNKENYAALNQIVLSGPIIFMAEAVETETAIMERMVLVTLKRPSALVSAKAYSVYEKFHSRRQILATLGLTLAARVAKHATVTNVAEEFNRVYAWARDRHMLRTTDGALVASGEMDEIEYTRRANNKLRNVYNNSVALFGLHKFKRLLRDIYAEEFEPLFGEIFLKLEPAIFNGLEVMAKSTVPEYIKILTSFSDMTRLPVTHPYHLEDSFEYNLTEVGGKGVLVLVPRASYVKYCLYTKHQGQTPLFPSEAAFAQAMLDVPQFIQKSSGTQRMAVETVVLDLDGLYRAGVPKFMGKIQKLAV